jgi:nucleoside-diphosphate-sugar epimerase
MMKVLVAGASGAIGRQLVPLLAAAGHQVVGLSRSSGSGALPAVDVLDRTAVLAAVHQVAPDAIVHMATAIPPGSTRDG